MGLSSWQSGLKGTDGNVITGQNYTAPDVSNNNQTVATIATILGLVALGLLAPELIPALLAEFAGEAGATATAAELASASDVEPWVAKALANPGDYYPDTFDEMQARYPDIYYAPGGPGGPPAYTMPDSQLPF